MHQTAAFTQVCKISRVGEGVRASILRGGMIRCGDIHARKVPDNDRECGRCSEKGERSLTRRT